MRASRKLLVTGLIISVILSGATILKVVAESQPVSDQQLESIRNNCVSVKNTLNQLRSSDALLRVNRGQAYESLTTKLMERFNGRVASNKLNNSNLVAVTNNYNTVLDTFRADYITYEKQLSAAISIDCSKQPAVFYDTVALARNERDQVHTDVQKLNQLIDQYRATLDQFETSYQVPVQGANQ